MRKSVYTTYEIDDVKKLVHDAIKKAGVATKKDLEPLHGISRKLDENKESLDVLGTLKQRLDTLDKILVSVDKIAGEVTTYRGQQELNSNTLLKHENRIEHLEKFTKIPSSAL